MKSIDELLELEPGLEYLGLTNLKKSTLELLHSDIIRACSKK